MKIISIFMLIASLFGCRPLNGDDCYILDGPGMVYVDRDYRTEYANTLPFDEIDDYPYWAVAYLGEGEDGKAAAKEYIERLFAELSEDKRNAVGHFDCGGEKMYLVIPRYGDDNEIILNGDSENSQYTENGTPYIISCNADTEIHINMRGGHKMIPAVDQNGRLIHTDDVWDITEYKNRFNNSH